MNERRFYTYGLFASPDGKSEGTCFYIGKGQASRMYTHVRVILNGRSSHNSKLDKKIKQLLHKSIKINHVIFRDGMHEQQAYNDEAVRIRMYSDHDLCNLTSGGNGGFIASDDTRRKMGDVRRGRKLSEDHKRSISIGKLRNPSRPWLGRKHSDETKLKMSAVQKGRAFSEETKKKMSESSTGKKHSEETKKKMSEAHLKNPIRYWKYHDFSEEHKRKISDANTGTGNAHYGKPRSAETRHKISETLKRKHLEKGVK